MYFIKHNKAEKILKRQYFLVTDAQDLKVHVVSQEQQKSIHNCMVTFNIKEFFVQSTVLSNCASTAGLTLSYHVLKHRASHNSMKCTSKLNTKLYYDSDITKKVQEQKQKQ